MNTMEKQDYSVLFHRDGHLVVLTREEYKADAEGPGKYALSFTPGKGDYYCIMAVSAVNKETAGAIAMVEQLNTDNAISDLIEFYLENNDWEIGDGSPIKPSVLEYLDEELNSKQAYPNEGQMKLSEMFKVLDGTFMASADEDPNTTYMDKREFEREQEMMGQNLIEIARLNRPDKKAYALSEDDIPKGWVRVEDLPSPGQQKLDL